MSRSKAPSRRERLGQSLPSGEERGPLRSIVPEQPSVLLYPEYIERTGIEFSLIACDRDLEGIVAKFRNGSYGEGWSKIRNPRYSQYEGRPELFERKRTAARLG